MISNLNEKKNWLYTFGLISIPYKFPYFLNVYSNTYNVRHLKVTRRTKISLKRQKIAQNVFNNYEVT